MENGVQNWCALAVDKFEMMEFVVASRWFPGGWMRFCSAGCMDHWAICLPQTGWMTTWRYAIFEDHLFGTVHSWYICIDFSRSAHQVSFAGYRISICRKQNIHQLVQFTIHFSNVNEWFVFSIRNNSRFSK